ncbi:MAG: sugar phosphate isomerase/epimerase family protein [Trueperaceae bacterium]
MKIAACTVMFPDLTPEEVVAELSEAGYDGIEWRVTNHDPKNHEVPSFWGNNLCTLNPTPQDAERAKQLTLETNLDVPNIGLYVGPDSGANALSLVEQGMQFAEHVGAPSVRVNPALYKGDYHRAFEGSLEFFRKVEALAKQYKVRALIETHLYFITPSASLTHRLVSHFDPTLVGVIYDPGCLAREGYEAYLMGLQLLGPYLAHVHLKNHAFVRPPGGGVWEGKWMPLEDGTVDYKDVIQSLLKVGYDGWLSIEDFSSFRPSREVISHNLRFIQNLLAEVQREHNPAAV